MIKKTILPYTECSKCGYITKAYYCPYCGIFIQKENKLLSKIEAKIKIVEWKKKVELLNV